MMHLSKERYIVRQLRNYLKNSNNPYSHRSYGVPLEEFRSYVNRNKWATLIENATLWRRIRHGWKMDFQQVDDYLKFAVDDNYVRKTQFGYIITAEGNRYASKMYPIRYIWKNWLEPYIFPAIISVIISLLIGFWINGQ